MFKVLKSLFNYSEEKKILVNNIFSLGVLQGANYLLPLFTLPYLVRILGPEYFGLLAFSSALIAYFFIITDYGFNLSATRQIAIHKKDKNKISQIFSSVISVKLGLSCLCFIVLLLLIFSVKKISDNSIFYLIAFCSVFANVFFPIWFFQGMEKMRYITLINLAAKFFFTVCIFYFVKAKDDLLLIPIFNSLGYLISAILSFFVLVNNLKLKFKIPNINDIKFQLIDGWSIFLTNLSISLYSISTPLVLGFYTNNETVAIFSGADKVIQAVKGLYSPFTQSLYPFISRKIKQNQFDGIKVVLKATMLIGVLMFMMSLLVYLFSEFIVLQLFGNQYRSSISVLKILSPLPFLIAISNIFGFQTSINLGFKAFLSRLYFFVGGISVFILFLMVPQFYENGAAITSILIEFIVLIVFIYYLIFKKNILRTND